MPKKLAKAYVQITEFCGLDCPFCEPKKTKSAQMELGLFEKINSELNGKTKTLAYHILGDPLTVKNLRDYLDISLRHSHAVELTTSGFYALKDASLLFHKSVKQINISLSAFFANRQTKGLEAYMQNVFELCDKSAENPKRFINLRLWNLGDDRYEQFNKEVEGLISKKYGVFDFDGAKTRFAPYAILSKEAAFEWPSIEKNKLKHSGSCLAISSQIGFLTDGTVVPCCLDAKGDMALGDITKNSLEEILSSKRAVDMLNGFKRGERVEKFCQSCSF